MFSLKDAFVSHVFSFGGRVFHKAGAADSNERAPKYFFLCPFTLGIFRSAREEERSSLEGSCLVISS